MSRGSVIKRGASWSVKLELERDPVTGKRRQKWHSGYRTKREAERARVELLAKLDAGVYIEPSKVTLAEFLEEWLATIAPTVRDSTHYSYERNVRLHVTPYIGRVRLDRVDAGILNGLYAKLLAEGRRDRPGGLSPRSVTYVHTIVGRAFRDAIRWGRLVRNPTDAADPPRASDADSRGPQSWAMPVLRDFLERSKGYGDRYYPLWVVIATTGMRRGEALGLRWADVDLELGRARIVQPIAAVGHEVRVHAPKTRSGRRSVALDAGTVTVLREWRRRQAKERLLIGPGYRDNGLVFAKLEGDPLHPERVSREFDRRVERWALPRLTLHGLRHTWATLALEAGVHPRVVQERLGHATVAVTLGIYSHVAPTLHDDAAELIGGRVLGL
jgi:integrase